MQNRRLLIDLLVSPVLALWFVTAALAIPCGAEIDKVQAAVDARIDAIAGSGHEGAETRAARMHRQPTPASIAAAEHRLHESEGATRALAALVRARKAARGGQESACKHALREARAAIAR
ncbi:MAG: hypothetical protein WBD42_05685 [Methylovirgula sp.]